MSLHCENQLGLGLVLTNWTEHFLSFVVMDRPAQAEKFLEYRTAGETRASLPNFSIFSSEPWFYQFQMTTSVQWR